MSSSELNGRGRLAHLRSTPVKIKAFLSSEQGLDVWPRWRRGQFGGGPGWARTPGLHNLIRNIVVLIFKCSLTVGRQWLPPVEY